MRVTETNGAGRITLDVGVDGTVHTLRNDSVRWVLRPPAASNPLLNSSRIYDVRMTNVNGQITELEMHGGGWGHGIGMCQVGAMGRARAGQRYDEILKAYYTGTEIQRLY
jgi:stage II sporulation protein D